MNSKGGFLWQNANGEFLNNKDYPREVRLGSSQLNLHNAELDLAQVFVDDSYRTVLSRPGSTYFP